MDTHLSTASFFSSMPTTGGFPGTAMPAQQHTTAQSGLPAMAAHTSGMLQSHQVPAAFPAGAGPAPFAGMPPRPGPGVPFSSGPGAITARPTIGIAATPSQFPSTTPSMPSMPSAGLPSGPAAGLPGRGLPAAPGFSPAMSLPARPVTTTTGATTHHTMPTQAGFGINGPAGMTMNGPGAGMAMNGPAGAPRPGIPAVVGSALPRGPPLSSPLPSGPLPSAPLPSGPALSGPPPSGPLPSGPGPRPTAGLPFQPTGATPAGPPPSAIPSGGLLNAGPAALHTATGPSTVPPMLPSSHASQGPAAVSLQHTPGSSMPHDGTSSFPSASHMAPRGISAEGHPSGPANVMSSAHLQRGAAGFAGMPVAGQTTTPTPLPASSMHPRPSMAASTVGGPSLQSSGIDAQRPVAASGPPTTGGFLPGTQLQHPTLPTGPSFPRGPAFAPRGIPGSTPTSGPSAGVSLNGSHSMPPIGGSSFTPQTGPGTAVSAGSLGPRPAVSGPGSGMMPSFGTSAPSTPSIPSHAGPQVMPGMPRPMGTQDSAHLGGPLPFPPRPGSNLVGGPPTGPIGQPAFPAHPRMGPPPSGFGPGSVSAPPTGMMPPAPGMHGPPGVPRPTGPHGPPGMQTTMHGMATGPTPSNTLAGGSHLPPGQPRPMHPSHSYPPSGGMPPPMAGGPPRPAAPAPRIDPNAIPRPKPSNPLKPVAYKTTGEGLNVPPPSWSDFVAEDTGNVNPRFVRCTLGHVPITKDILKESKIPLAVVVNALSMVGYGEQGVAVVQDENGPVRCSRCRGYMNPFVHWEEGGNTWICNLCRANNETPDYYRYSIDQYGQRNDRRMRPELSLSSIEFVAPPSFCVRPPVPLHIMFMLDATYQAVASGAFTTALKAVQQSVEQLANMYEGSLCAGLAVFDTRLHFFDISAHLKEPRRVIAPDIDEAFAPLAPAQCMPAIVPSYHLWQQLFTLVPSMFIEPSRNVPQGCFGSALKAGVDCLAETGGRLVIFQSSLPQLGEGKLTNRERIAAYGTDEEQTLYTSVSSAPTTEFYKELGKSAAAKGVSIFHNALTSSSLDLATVSEAVTLTGGELRLYPFFQPAAAPPAPTLTPAAAPPSKMGGPSLPPQAPQPAAAGVQVAEVSDDLQQKVIQEVCHIFMREIGFEAVMKIRTSPGLRVGQFNGNIFDRADSEADLGGLDSESAVIATLLHDGNSVKEGDDLHVQVAVLYTTAYGSRRIRIHNLRLVGTESIQAVFRHADIDSILTYMVRQGVFTARRKGMKPLPKEMDDASIEMLHSYRRNCAANSSPGQLILPESLKFLPLYVAALGKTPAFALNRPSKILADIAVRADLRAIELCLLNGMTPGRLIPYVYPRMLQLHKMGGMHGVPLDSDDDAGAERPAMQPESLSSVQLNRVMFPPSTYPSVLQLAAYGVHLLEHSTGLFIHVGIDADEDFLHEVFGPEVSKASMLAPGTVLPRLDTDLSRRVWTVIAALRFRRPPYLPVVVVAPTDVASTSLFHRLLVEDKVGDSESYVEILCEMHKQIQTKLQS